MICAAVFDTYQDTRTKIRDWLVQYLIQSNTEIEVLWFTEPVSDEKLKKYGAKIDFALINLNDEAGDIIGKRLYCENPSCRICYYRKAPCDIVPLLSSRPISFYLWDKGKGEFLETIKSIVDELYTAKDMFRFETKREMYIITLHSILYVQSDLKHVLIHTTSGTQERIFAKLSQIESELNGRFVRVHKSYIVNSEYVRLVDKRGHQVVLINGEHIPISDSQHKIAMQKLRASETQ